MVCCGEVFLAVVVCLSVALHTVVVLLTVFSVVLNAFWHCVVLKSDTSE